MAKRIAYLALLLCGHAYAQDCDRTVLAEKQQLSAYLLAYGISCTRKPADDYLAARYIRVNREAKEEKARGELDASKLIPVWQELSENFTALAARAPQSQLSGAYSALAERAKSARLKLTEDVIAKKSQDANANFYGAVAWAIPPDASSPADLYFPRVPGGPPMVDIFSLADKDCVETASALCRSALASGKELMLNWRLAADLSWMTSKPVLDMIGDQVKKKRELWRQYLNTSKPMLPPDHFITDLLDGRWKKSDQYPEGFREPPDTQWFLLHPSVAVEQLGAAPDGEEFKAVLVLEVFGANRWREDRRWFPVWGLKHLSGASLAVTYADRAGVRDTGIGPLLTFDNVYSVGLMYYGSSKTGLLFSIDLSSLFREKYQDKYESFKQGVQNKLF